MKIKTLSVIQIAYIAGIFDGEGSVLYKGTRNIFAVTQSEKGIEMLRYLKQVIGRGTVYLHQKPRKESHLPVYRYRLASLKMSKELFRQILPYLIVKRGEVEKAIEE